jgi:hypothetical protein
MSLLVGVIVTGRRRGMAWAADGRGGEMEEGA